MRSGGRSHGFTVVEMAISTFLLALLLQVFVQAWKDFAQPAIEAQRRSRIALEASLARECLARDFSGIRPEDFGKSLAGDDLTGRLLSAYAALNGAPQDSGGNELHLVYSLSADGSISGTVVYRLVEDDQGNRIERSTGSTRYTVARQVDNIQVNVLRKPQAGRNDPTEIEILLTFVHASPKETSQRTYRFIGVVKP